MTDCYSVIVTEVPGENWQLNLDGWNDGKDIPIPPEVGKAILALMEERRAEGET